MAASAESPNSDPSLAYKVHYGPYPASTSKSASKQDTRVDINRASLDDLLKVPGMTRSWAGRVVRFRPYRTKLDLTEHGVLTGQVYDRIKDYVIAHRDTPEH
jgi:DNA uptake protein ComE-like DNA-binding protein